MIHSKFSGWVIGIFGLALAWTLPADAGIGASSTVIVMPARNRVVQLAFEVAQVKDVGLVAYNNSPTLAAPLIHVWSGSKWVQITMDEYLSGAFLPSGVRHVFILGDSTTLPEAMKVDPAWAKNVHKTADYGVASLLNQLGPVLKFSSLEWRWLAEQNGLMLTDQNAERRRYGRWGKAGVDESRMPQATEAAIMPPEPPVLGLKESVPPKAPVAVPPVDAVKPPEAIAPPLPEAEVKPAEVKFKETPKPAAPAPETKSPEAKVAEPPALTDKVETTPAAPASTNAPAVADPTVK